MTLGPVLVVVGGSADDDREGAKARSKDVVRCANKELLCALLQ